MRFRLYPTSTQESLLLEACGQARFVWNLGLEQRLMWARWKGPTPGYNAQSAQLTQARAASPWLAAGSQTVQQQALRDLDQAWRNFFAGTHRRPTWRKQGRHEGLRVVGAQALRARADNHRWSSVLVPKVGWVRFRRSRALPAWKSYRITRDRAGRWHLGLAAIPAPVPGPGTGQVVGVDRGVAVAVALSTGELTSPAGLRPGEAGRLLRLQRRLARSRRRSNRRTVLKAQVAGLKARQADRRKDWVEKTSTDLARRFDVIRVEDLKVASMTRTARGTLAKAGPQGRPEGGVEPGHPGRRLGRAGDPAGAQGPRSGGEGQSCVHVPDLLRLWVLRSGEPQEPSGLRLRLLRASGQCGCERGTQYCSWQDRRWTIGGSAWRHGCTGPVGEA